MMIGDVEIPIVGEISNSDGAEVEEIKALNGIDSVPVKHEPSVDTITIVGFLNEHLHSQELTIDEQKSRVNLLRTRNVEDNTIDYKEYYGTLLVQEVSVAQNSENSIVNEVEIIARYLPWPKYNSEVQI